MKKIVFLLVTVFAINFVNAQDSDIPARATFSRGDKWLEGGISLTTGDSSDDYFAMTPKFGYFLDKKWAIGADINYASIAYLPNTNSLDKSDSFGIGGFVRYYFLSLGNFKAYGEVGLGFNQTKLKYLDGSSTKNDGIKANVDLGIHYFFSTKWAVTFTIAEVLSYNNTSPENGDNSSDLVININLFNNIFAQPKFGLLYKW